MVQGQRMGRFIAGTRRLVPRLLCWMESTRDPCSLFSSILSTWCLRPAAPTWSAIYFTVLPSVLWRCWLGGRKGIRPVKNWVVGCWRGADLHTAQLMPLSLASVKSRLVLPLWYRPTWVVLDKGPLNVCSVVVLFIVFCVCLQCFDTVEWAAGRASGL